MPILDAILPPSIDPFVRNVINVLVGIHIAAFLLYIYLLTRSSMKTQADEFKEGYKKMEASAAEKAKVKK